jgi:hypothetical protein
MIEDFSKYVFLERDLNGGTQIVYKFPNGFGASVITGPYTYGGSKGLFEMALLKFEGDKWDLVYHKDFADGDVAGYLSVAETNNLLNWIANIGKKSFIRRIFRL